MMMRDYIAISRRCCSPDQQKFVFAKQQAKFFFKNIELLSEHGFEEI